LAAAVSHALSQLGLAVCGKVHAPARADHEAGGSEGNEVVTDHRAAGQRIVQITAVAAPGVPAIQVRNRQSQIGTLATTQLLQHR
jgi:hypothetical protein